MKTSLKTKLTITLINLLTVFFPAGDSPGASSDAGAGTGAGDAGAGGGGTGAGGAVGGEGDAGGGDAPVIPDTGAVELKGFTLNDEQIGKLNLTDEQKALHKDGKGIDFTKEQRDALKGFVKAPSGDAPVGAPEAYTDFTVPDGMTIDADTLAAFTPKFKELNLSQQQAQDLVSAYATSETAKAKAAQEAYEGTVKEWETQAKADKDIGGDKFDESKRLAAVALSKVGTDALGKFFDQYGIGSHPEIVRLMRKVGELVQEDRPGAGGTPPNTPKDQASILYPTGTDN